MTRRTPHALALAVAAALAAAPAFGAATVTLSPTQHDAFITLTGQGSFASVVALTPELTNATLLGFSSLDGTFSNVRYTFYSDAGLTAAIGNSGGYALRTTGGSTSFTVGSALNPFSDPVKTAFNLAAGTTYYVKLTGTLGDADGYGQLKISAADALIAAVPEPGAWAMLLAGLGIVGSIARRRMQRD